MFSYSYDVIKEISKCFLLNLAVADLMVCLVTMSTEILFVAFGEWVLGAVACKLIVYAQIVTLASTTFLLTVMSIDRHQVRPEKSQMSVLPVVVWLADKNRNRGNILIIS